MRTYGNAKEEFICIKSDIDGDVFSIILRSSSWFRIKIIKGAFLWEDPD